MSAEEINALARRLLEKWNKGKAAYMAAIDEIFAANIIHHGGGGEEIRGLKDYKQHVSEFYNAFPDLHFTINDMIAEGDKVAMRTTLTGTHTGEWRDILPTNKKVMDWRFTIARIVDGKIVESWSKADTLGEAQQLGLIPTPKKEK